MSGDSFPLVIPVARFASETCEATTLFQELRKPLLRYLVCLGLSADEAQDVVQEAFLRLHRHLSSAGPQQNLRSWLFRVAHNEARNRQQSYHRRFASPLDQEIDVAMDETTPEEAMLEKDKFRRFRAAIKFLTQSERECLLLRAEGLRYRDIAEVLGIAQSTVPDTVERAIKKLAEKCNV